MKKIFFLLLFPLLVLFNSCLDNGDDTLVGVEPGTIIYGLARAQVDLDIDPMTLAFKLNTLIATADELNTNYSTAKVTIGEGDDAKEIVVVDQLFGANNTVTKSGDEWHIDFKQTTRQDKDKYYRVGEVTINTNGYSLEDLAGDPSRRWEIVIPDNGYQMHDYSGNNFVNKISSCVIAAGEEPNTWVLEGHSTSYIPGNQEYAANWDFAYEVFIPGEVSFSYTTAVNATYYLNAEVVGVPCTVPSRIKYTAVDLKYKPRCYMWIIYGGIEYAEGFDRSVFNLETFPELKVKYTWHDQSATSPCQSVVDISYDGVTVTT